MTEDHLEQEVLGWLADVGYTPLDGPDLAPDGSSPERGHYREVALEGRLRSAIARLNPAVPAAAREDALRQVLTQLRERFGSRFDELDHTGRLVSSRHGDSSDRACREPWPAAGNLRSALT